MSDREPSEDQGELVRRLRAGDEAAYAELIHAHGGRLLVTAERLLSDRGEAQDAVQEAFLAAFRSLESFREDARLGTWLHRILVNAALMRLRGRKRRPELAIDPLLPKYLAGGHQEHIPERWEAAADVAAEREETRELVRKGLTRLPESYRTVLTLRDIEGLSSREAAEALGDTVGAVRVRLHRARQALRNLLAPHMREVAV